MGVGECKTDAGVAPASGAANGVGWGEDAALKPTDAGVATASGVANGVGWGEGTDAGVAPASGVANGVGWGEGTALELNTDSALGALLVECLLISATRDVSHPIISIAPRM